MYDAIIRDLRMSYDRSASEREVRPISDWKIVERARFLDLLMGEGKRTLLEIGSGPGHHGKFFQERGLDVVCTDLSPEMVRLCRDKGLRAYAMDFLGLHFPEGSYDAVFALNCLLHVPRADLPKVLERVHGLLAPRGLFYLGLYGGKEYEGVYEGDTCDPKRFFCFHTDERIRELVERFFELVYFKPIPLEADDLHFQSMIVRKSDPRSQGARGPDEGRHPPHS